MSVCGALREPALKISLVSKLLPRLNESYPVATGDRARIRTAVEPQSAVKRRGGESPGARHPAYFNLLDAYTYF